MAKSRCKPKLTSNMEDGWEEELHQWCIKFIANQPYPSFAPSPKKQLLAIIEKAQAQAVEAKVEQLKEVLTVALEIK